MIPIAERALPILSLRLNQAQPERVHRYAHGAVVSVKGLRVTVQTELAAVDLLYWIREGDRLLISPDARMLYRRGMTPDPRGLLSLITLGMPFPPYTLFREMRAFQPGALTTIDLRDLSMSSRSSVAWSDRDDADLTMPPERQVDTLLEALDAGIEDVLTPAQPIVLFSGGVDSSVLAWRMRELGRSDTLLVHYSFGEDSPDTIAAGAMSRALGLEMAIVSRGHDDATDILDRAPEIYRQPFADHSAVPTATLVRFAVDRAQHDALMLDGTGADGAFGLNTKARRYRVFDRCVPKSARGVLGWPYRGLGLWKRTGRAEKATRLLYRLGTMSDLMASIAMSPMLGIGVVPDPKAWRELNETIDRWADLAGPSDDPSVRMQLADLSIICAGVFAQKDYWFAADRDVRLRYPYLRQRIMDLALRHACRWPGSDRPKHALKLALERVAPREVIQRPKTGFVSSKFEIFSERPILERIEALADANARIHALIDRSVVRTIVDAIDSGHTFSPPIYNFLWGALIAESWLRGIEQAAASIQESTRAARHS